MLRERGVVSHIRVTRGDDVRTTIVNGRVLMRDRKVLTLDEAARTGTASIDQPPLVEGAALAIDNERLKAELRARVEELRVSRLRIVEAADDVAGSSSAPRAT